MRLDNLTGVRLFDIIASTMRPRFAGMVLANPSDAEHSNSVYSSLERVWGAQWG